MIKNYNFLKYRNSLFIISVVLVITLFVNGCVQKAAKLNIEDCKNKYPEGGARENCIESFALATNDVALCQELSTYKEHCIFRIAKNRANFEMCKDIKDKGLFVSCYREISKIKKDSSICLEITKNRPDLTSSQDDCLMSNNGACENIIDNHFKAICFHDLGIKTGDVEKCKNIPVCLEKYEYVDCINKIALSKEDVTLCDGIKQECNQPSEPDKETLLYERNNCIIQIAKSTNNPRLCDLIDESTEASRARGDMRYCNYVLTHDSSGNPI